MEGEACYHDNKRDDDVITLTVSAQRSHQTPPETTPPVRAVSAIK